MKKIYNISMISMEDNSEYAVNIVGEDEEEAIKLLLTRVPKINETHFLNKISVINSFEVTVGI